LAAYIPNVLRGFVEGEETPQERMFRRQELRGELVARYWDLLGCRPGSRIADVGCGPGYFTLRLAALTGPAGHVHAVDADAAALAYLRARLDPVHHAHVTMEHLDVVHAPLPGLAFDAILCADMLHHVDDVPRALRHLRETPARLLIAEFDPAGAGEVGPPLEMRLAPDALRAALAAAGWRAGDVVALGQEHYAVLSLPAS
jgi:ubiquinone/menaquinone biosynthesis C-methylase UbiE